MMTNETGWGVEVVVTVKGPKEGAVIVNLKYEDTTKEVAKLVQNAIAKAVVELNG